MHLIRIPKKKERERAIMALLKPHLGPNLALPDYQFFLTDEQVQALEGAGVAFTYLSKTGPNGTKPPAVQS